MTTSITVGNVTIHKSGNGLYSLRDLQLSHGNKSKRPKEWLVNKATQEYIAFLKSEIPPSLFNQWVIEVIHGNNGDSFVCKELVYSYAMWVSPKFHHTVIKTFDAVINAASNDDLIAAQEQAKWVMGELTAMEARQPKDKNSFSAILGIPSSQAYPFFKYLVGIGELEQETVPQPDKFIYRPTRNSKIVIGQKGTTVLFDDSVRKLFPTQTSWVEGGIK